MTLKGRLEKLEHSTPDNQAHMDARELLKARFDRADAETKERLLKAIERARDKKC